MNEPEGVEFLREAIRLAVESVESGNGGPFGAVVVKNGTVIGRGSNRVTSDNDPTAHAEIEAIREACRSLGSFQLTGCDIYCSSEPCPMCMAAIYWARPQRVVYAADKHSAALAGFDDEFIYEELAKPIEARSIRMRQLDVKEAGQALALWESLDDKVEY
jgi:tRNA(Arg) A34 adenosine deaminase TadA